jgi:RNA polymerase sigma factor for flagellar operon FliA
VSKPAETYRDVGARQRRDELILAHLPLVRHTLGRLLAQLPPGLDVDNLESAGTLGLVEAASRFDPDRGVKFEAYAGWRIRGAILDELRRNCPLPQHILERVAKLRNAYQELPAPVSVEALAAATGFTEDEINDAFAAMRITRMSSWENLAESRQKRLTAAESVDPSVLEDQKKLLAQGIATLAESERLVVTLYYLEDLRLKEIGHILKLSESRVSRLLNAAMFHLGEFMRLHEGD